MSAVQVIAEQNLYGDDYFWNYQQSSANSAAAFLICVKDHYNIQPIINWLTRNTAERYGQCEVAELLNAACQCVQYRHLHVDDLRSWLDCCYDDVAKQMFGKYTLDYDEY